MAVLDVSFFSDVLQVSTRMTVILPERATGAIGVEAAGGDALPPVLYLLHGLSDDETIWLRRTSIDRYASERGLAVVMPRAERSFYQDEKHGSPYWTFLTEELPVVVNRLFRVSQRREDTYVAGLSMGGYGAMRWALAYPQMFTAAASLSGAIDLGARAGAWGEMYGMDADSPFLAFTPDVRDRVFGGSFEAGGDNDLVAQLSKADPAALPRLWVSCGAQDPLLAHSQHFVAAAEARGIPVEVSYPDGVHEWGLWDSQILKVLNWGLPASA